MYMKENSEVQCTEIHKPLPLELGFLLIRISFLAQKYFLKIYINNLNNYTLEQ